MTENIATMTTDQLFQSTSDALEIAKMAEADSNWELYEQAMDFYYRETSLMKTVEVILKIAMKAVEKKDWDMCRRCFEDVYSFMPVTWARTLNISRMYEARLIIATLHDSDFVNIADKGSSANILATKALEYTLENGSPEERHAIMKGANPQLYEILSSPLGITDDGLKVIDVDDCAKALGIPVQELLEVSPDSAFLPEGTKINPIQ